MNQRSKALFLTVFLSAPGFLGAEVTSSEAQKLALAAFKDPVVRFQGHLILTEWRQKESHAQEINLLYTPGIYRIEFLGVDGAVKKSVISESGQKVTLENGHESQLLSRYPPMTSRFLTSENLENLLIANYTFSIKGNDTYIGRAVWVLEMTPLAAGKPTHILKIDKKTKVVLEDRRFLANEDVGSLSQFLTFEPNPSFAEGTFNGFAPTALLETKDTDPILAATPPSTPPREELRSLPAGFSLSDCRTIDLQGKPAQHYYYSDGVLPLSVFETKQPVKFPPTPSLSQKMDYQAVSNPGLVTVDHVVYGKSGKHYITLIGEMSPDLLQTIARRFN